jgi:ABC-2 type transport system ATP-binding protein
MEAAFRETVGEAKERGQTIFLSSHILSEVEALCDRVGILRAGRLVDEGTLGELRKLRAQTVEVTFEGPPPDLRGIEGVQVVGAGERTVHCEVSGAVGPLLNALAGLPVRSLTSREPSLEEIFLHHYDGSDGASGPDAPRGPDAPHGPRGPHSPDAPHGPRGPHSPDAPHAPDGDAGR